MFKKGWNGSFVVCQYTSKRLAALGRQQRFAAQEVEVPLINRKRL